MRLTLGRVMTMPTASMKVTLVEKFPDCVTKLPLLRYE
jgi:hypothetical protein